MFAYCLNNPVNMIDVDGNMPTGISGGSGYKKEQDEKVDITDRLDSAMKVNAQKLSDYKEKNGYAKASVYFYKNVKTGGKWDYKNQSTWGLSSDKEYYWHGTKLRHDDIGNIHYGYVGKVLFDTPTLLIGAGAAQLKSDLSYKGAPQWTVESFYDDPHDQKMVEAGCILWDYGF